MLPGAKMLDFGTPLAPSGVQNGAQNRKSGAQEALYAPVRAPPPGRVLERTFLQDPFLNVILSILTLLGTILVDIGWILKDFVWILASFFNDVGHVSAAAFAECRRRLARSETTENVKNMQIT